MEDIIVIIGPTAIGKTKLSIELAKKINAEIINGDSVAIYKKLDIGSAKPLKEEQDGIYHHLIDICDVEDNYSVYNYQQDVRRLIEDIRKRGKRIIIVGGTGLYIKAALFNYEFDHIEGKIENNYDNLTNEEIRNKLLEYNKDLDIHVNNRKRLIRLLDKYENGEKITNKKDEALYNIKTIALTTDRSVLYERINKRVDIMIKNGLVNEITDLKDYYLKSRILNQAIGYKEFYGYLFENENLESVIQKIKLNCRRYAKRQYTFFKNQFSPKWIEVDLNNFNNTINEVYEYIKK